MKLIVVILLISISAPTIAGQRKSKAPKKTEPQAAPVVFDNKPFDLSREALPPNYIGTSLLGILAALLRRSDLGTKQEFESTIDYNARIDRAMSLPLLGSISGKDRMAFAVRLDSFDTRYDADLGVLDFSLNWFERIEVGFRSLFVRYHSTSKFLRKYVGRNAFNRAVSVSACQDSDYFVGAETADLARVEGTERLRNPFSRLMKYSASVPLPPSTAMKVKPNLTALVIRKLATKPISTGTGHDTPTIDIPIDRYNYYYAVNLKPIAIWFYDKSSGVVYAKLNAK